MSPERSESLLPLSCNGLSFPPSCLLEQVPDSPMKYLARDPYGRLPFLNSYFLHRLHPQSNGTPFILFGLVSPFPHPFLSNLILSEYLVELMAFNSAGGAYPFLFIGYFPATTPGMLPPSWVSLFLVSQG